MPTGPHCRPEAVAAGQDQGAPVSAVAMAIGTIAGALIGFVLWIATDTFALLPAFLGVGLVLGMALQSAAGNGNGKGPPDQ